MSVPPTYHDLHITTERIERISIFNLPFRVQVHCTRVGGWEVWALKEEGLPEELLGGEYAGPGKGLRLDVAGHVVVDSLARPSGEQP